MSVERTKIFERAFLMLKQGHNYSYIYNELVKNYPFVENIEEITEAALNKYEQELETPLARIIDAVLNFRAYLLFWFIGSYIGVVVFLLYHAIDEHKNLFFGLPALIFMSFIFYPFALIYAFVPSCLTGITYALIINVIYNDKMPNTGMRFFIGSSLGAIYSYMIYISLFQGDTLRNSLMIFPVDQYILSGLMAGGLVAICIRGKLHKWACEKNP